MPAKCENSFETNNIIIASNKKIVIACCNSCANKSRFVNSWKVILLETKVDKNYQWYLVNLHSDKTDYVSSRQVSKNKIILLSIHWCRCVMPKRLMAILIIRQCVPRGMIVLRCIMITVTH